ncbi:MAG: hypothetical protein RSB47_00610 [Ruthenibacterium sp.]
MMKKIICMFSLLLLLITPVFAQETDDNEITPPPAAWQEIIESAPITADAFKAMTITDYLHAAAEMLHGAFTAPLRLFAKLCTVLILCAVARSLAEETPPGALALLLESVSSLAAFAVCAPSVLRIMGEMQSALEEIRVYLSLFVPAFSAVLISCGQAGGAAIYGGFFFGASMLITDVLCRFGLPLTRVFLAFHAVGVVGSPLDTENLANQLEKWLKTILVFCSTVFVALLSLQSVIAQSADTLALKTGKLLIGSSVPVVGRAVSDAMGSVIAGLQMLKGSLGFAAIAVLAAAFLPLILQCVAYHLVFSLAQMIAAATGNDKCAKLLRGFAQCISLYLSMTFFFCLVVVSATMLMLLLGGG